MNAFAHRALGRRFPDRSRLAAKAALVALAMSSSGVARAEADVSSKAAAEGLFDQGRELMKKGDFKNACGYLERSQQIDPAVGTLLYLAECYEKAGRIASAWATFREAASSARAVGQADRARLGDERAARLTPVLPRLAIEVPEATRAIPGLVIRRQGQTIPAAAWDVAVPLDPGRYEIEATAVGYDDFKGTVQVGGDATTARIVIPPLTPAQGAAVTPPAAEQPGAQTTTAPPGPELHGPSEPRMHEPGPSVQRTIAYVLGGVGILGLGAGSFFGLRAMSKNDDAEEHCPRGRECDDLEGVKLGEDADQAATISNIAFGVGAAALAGGVVLYFTDRPSREEPKPSVAARVTPSGVWLTGKF